MSGLHTGPVSDLNYYTYNQVIAFHILEITASVLSVIVGIIAVTLWMRMDPSRRVIFRLQLLLTLIISDFFKALFILGYGCTKLISFHNQQSQMIDVLSEHRVCDGWGYLREVATIYADLTIMTLTFHNAFMILKPQWSKIHAKYPLNFKKMCKRVWFYFLWKIEFKDIFKYKDPNDIVYVNEGGVYPLRFYISIIIFIIAFLFPGLIFVHGGHYQYNFSCSAPESPVWKRLLAGWVIRYINLITIMCIYSFIIIYLIIHFRSIEKSKKKLYHEQYSQDYSQPEPLNNVTNVTHTLQKELMNLTAENNAKRRHAVMRELKSFAIYPIGYWIIWLTPTISQIYNYIDAVEYEPFALLVFVAFMVPLSCTVDCIIFFVREKPWNCTSRALTRRNQRRASDHEIAGDEFKPSVFASHASADQPSPHTSPSRGAIPPNQRLPVQLGFTHDPELAYTTVDDSLDVEKIRENSLASSNLSNMKTLVGSKRASVLPNLASVQDNSNDQEISASLNNRNGSHDSSGTNATATVGLDDENQDLVDSGVDMIDFLREY